ncbi:Hypothetical Protein FCC1311_094992 [Hondaea fermentalgiana]|uniref:Uncharacterized protein n=1 Tax=Hondaea fermentalgiana TaxID=2315210 RepID=A0A2R5GRP7_9STRA|nr:Hypothetical Protein FCC1311_094992 [Hondaea fermentalgiana]|eukprot:GBG33275.1 Hypothetical Protein FCC1311_094992 [Hondaea fermentalgiana]
MTAPTPDAESSGAAAAATTAAAVTAGVGVVCAPSTVNEQDAAQTAQEDQDKAAEDYVRFMRKELCPEEMVNEDGTLNEAYFQPKSDVSGVEWDADALQDLYKGLAQIGIGEWAKIKAKYLPLWDELAIRFKTCLLVGSQDLSQYEGRKMTIEDLEAARTQNEQEAKRNGTWHYGVRVSSAYGLQYKP